MELKEIIQKLQTAIEIYTFFGQYEYKMYSRSMSPKKLSLEFIGKNICFIQRSFKIQFYMSSVLVYSAPIYILSV